MLADTPDGASTSDPERLRFESPEAFRDWLTVHQDTNPGVWLVLGKKGSRTPALTYAQALEVALAYGWIDGQARRLDDETYVQRFTPRRARSPWSLRNRRAAEAMIASGAMTPRGLAEVERARSDGRWERAYAGPRTAEPPADLVVALEQNPAARDFYATLNSQNRYAIYYRIQAAQRADTRARRIAAMVAMLARGERLHN